MTPAEIDIPTLEYVASEIRKDRNNYAVRNARNQSFLAAMDEIENSILCVIARIKRGEGLRPTSQLMGE